MNKISKVAALGATLVMSTSASALDMPDMSGYYYNVQYAMLDLDVSSSSGSGSASIPGVALEIGTNVYSHDIADIYLEAVLVLGLDEDTAFGSSISRYQAGLDSAVGLQAKAHHQFNGDIAGFINLGLMNVSTTVVNEGNYGGAWVRTSSFDSASNTGVTFAFGAEYKLSGTSAVTLSYNNMSTGDNVDVTSINIGYKSTF
ncbi:MAG: outer membrane beta-barrel protein [Gammaproteobacteria bacterium]|nr:outer membrane beta-barrel protein [Gammaproteobacteria bacterium]